MAPLKLSIHQLARDLHVPPTRISEIVDGRRAITADIALRLARYFGNSPRFWMDLQAVHDLEVETRRSASRITREIRPRRRSSQASA